MFMKKAFYTVLLSPNPKEQNGKEEISDFTVSICLAESGQFMF